MEYSIYSKIGGSLSELRKTKSIHYIHYDEFKGFTVNIKTLEDLKMLARDLGGLDLQIDCNNRMITVMN